jgi:conjugative transfer region lipoprotein (TIGR03751 family)
MTQEEIVCLTSTDRYAALILALVLSGCATHKEKLLPHGDVTMLDVWNQATAGDLSGARPSRALLDARESLRRPLTGVSMGSLSQEGESYTRTAENEVDRQFFRLPNPDLVMYVFPHLGGTEPVPVPGYSTVFPFFSRVQYAMPGERTEEY